ncbi:CHAT domain-containing protein [Streptomyces sp. NPDC059850]|uniref:CHAT domain-containing protein n=1 Tax=Streptomyces sp. NPDC059850 TaxID=3346970 RepID=UPI003652722C
MGDYLDENVRRMIREAMADPDRKLLFSGDSRESVLSPETLRNMAGIVDRARDRLTPERAGAASVDIEAVYLAACFHLARAPLAPECEAAEDRLASGFLFSVVHALRPAALPRPLRVGLAGTAPQVAPAWKMLHAIAVVLLRRGASARDEAGLWRAAEMFHHTREMAPGKDMPGILFNEGSTLATLFDLTGDQALLTAAVALMRQAVAAFPDDAPPPAEALAALAEAQAKLAEAQAETAPPGPTAHDVTPGGRMVRYSVAGAPGDLETSIADVRKELAATADGAPAREGHRISLGNLLRMRFEATGHLGDLTEAIGVLRVAVRATTDDDALRCPAYSLLGLALLDQFVTTHEAADLDAATEAARNSMAGSAPLSPHYGQTLTNLAAVLYARFETYGDFAELAEAIRHLEHAVAATPPHQHDHPVMRIKLAVALGARGKHTGRITDVDRGTELLRSVLDTVQATSPHWQVASLELGALLTARSNMTRAPGDLLAAMGQFRATALAPGEDIRSRLRAAFLWGLNGAYSGDLPTATEAFGLALDDLLPKLTGRALDRRSREVRLRELPSLACVAAAVEITAGRPEEALVRLERGRGVLLAQALRLRGRHGELAEAAPELAGRFERVCDALIEERGTAEQRAALTAEFDALLAEIRGLGGFERFHRPLGWARLRTVAAQGPVVVLNVSELRCDALLLHTEAEGGNGVEVLPLAGVTRAEVSRRAEGFHAAVAALSSAAALTDGDTHQQAMEETLEWLWKHIAGPVLTRLGLDRPVSPEAEEREWPRLWWCPTGPLALLPLHAARCRSDGSHVQDRVVSSYTPTLAALLHARERAAGPSGPPTLAAVGVSAPPPGADGAALPPLPAVGAELAAVAGLPVGQSRLQDADATPGAVLAALRTHPYAHLACHGSYDPENPSAGGLVLHGGELTVHDLTTERMGEAEFACLSACHTAAPGTALVDEVITLASAFQLCGYRHVIGSLWTLKDAVTPALARDLYGALGAARSTAGSARALHRAVQRLRAERRYARPLFWASMIHIGP